MRQKSNSLLVEILIVIMFFALASTVIVQLFATAHRKSVQTKERNMAMITLQSVVEQVQASAETGKTTVDDKTYPLSQPLVLFFDKDWNRGDQSSPYYIRVNISHQTTPAGMLRTVEAEAFAARGSRSVYSLSAKRYLPK